jgi:triacylglycerol lipase
LSVSRHLVDPELLPFLDTVASFELSDEMLPAIRAGTPHPQMDAETAAHVAMSHRHAPGPAGAPEVAVVCYRPRAATGRLPAILHLHGGGFIGGKAENSEALHGRMAVKLNCVIASVNYRLAPETKFPGNLEDCYAALAWLLADAELNVDPARVGVMGQSAGGGLAAALALLVRDRGEHTLAFQHLIYPMLDDRTSLGRDPHPFAGEFLWTAHNNRYGWRALLGDAAGSGEVSPYAAPARAADLSGLPPAFISTGALDLFTNEDIDYARRLIFAGVPTDLRVYAGGFHTFDRAPGAGIARQARADSLEALRRSLR